MWRNKDRRFYQLLLETDNGYRPTMNLVVLLWKLGVIVEYQSFYDAEATTNTINFTLKRRRRSR